MNQFTGRKIALRLHRPATTLYDMTAQALLFEDDEKKARMQAFLDERARRRAAKQAAAADAPTQQGEPS